MQDVLTLTRIANHYCNLIEGAGMEVRLSSDFRELEWVTAINEQAVTPHFSTQENTFVKGDAFWVGIWKDNHCVATLAAKLQALGDESLASYAQRYWSQAYQRGSQARFQFQDSQKRALEQFTGNLVYCGEYRVLPDLQRTGVGTWIASMTKALVFANWPQTDHIYIFMENKSVRQGLAAAITMTRQIPNALKWEEPPTQAQRDYWMASLSALDFQDWVDDQICLLRKVRSKE